MTCNSKTVFVLFLLIAAGAHAADLPSATPESVGMSSSKLERVTELIMPFNFDTEWLLKPVIYDAIEE